VGGKPSGVQIRPQDYADFVEKVRLSVDVAPDVKARFEFFLLCQTGKPYDYAAIWAFFVNRNWRDTNSWICSELQAAAAEHAGVVPHLYLAAPKITPVAWALAASAGGAQVTP
jgi:hypothetical protein